jgi:adenine-specific DNA-methyltransferase
VGQPGVEAAGATDAGAAAGGGRRTLPRPPGRRAGDRRRGRGRSVYLDPPYTQHSYLGNYHVWESLVLWDRPETYGVANKRVDVRTRKSAFNSRPGIGPALNAVIEAIRAPNLIVSFNDEGYLSRDQLVEMLSARGHVQVVEIPRPRYVGARIGIHNPKGDKVGTVGRLRNVEYLFVVSDRRLNLADAA